LAGLETWKSSKSATRGIKFRAITVITNKYKAKVGKAWGTQDALQRVYIPWMVHGPFANI
jgi:hypothetical protein